MTHDRHYPLSRRPTVIGVARPAADLVEELTQSIEDALGASVRVEARGTCLVLPPLHEIRKDGRALRGEERAEAREVIAAIAEGYASETLRWTVEEMYVFDWDAFEPRHRQALEAAYARLPGWLGFDGMPRWFGRDEALGPCLWASVEPPGLQVWGILEPPTFEGWHRELLDRTRQLPCRAPLSFG